MIQYVPEVGSTNEVLRGRVAAGEHVPEGDWLVADRQTAGKGRQGRTWSDSAGNFMGSTLVRTRHGDPPPPTLALVAGLSVHAAVDLAQARLKWPNDLVVGTRKLAGMLLETAGNAVILGVGVNLVAAPPVPGRETAAVAEFAAPPARDDFAETLAARFDLELQRWRDFGMAPIVRRWLAAAHPEGTRLEVELAGERIVGAFAGLEDSGGLRLRLADGSLRVIHAGEVSLVAAEGT